MSTVPTKVKLAVSSGFGSVTLTNAAVKTWWISLASALISKVNANAKLGFLKWLKIGWTAWQQTRSTATDAANEPQDYRHEL